MLAEALGAAIIGILALWLLLQPLLKPTRRSAPPPEPIDLEETPKGVALSALKEIEFDRETGKLSEQDYEMLKSRYTAAALEALRDDSGASAPEPVAGDIESMIAARVRTLRFASGTTPSDAGDLSAPVCSSCGPRPEPDAVFCSACGHRLSATSICAGCGAALTPGTTFCGGCGRVVAA